MLYAHEFLKIYLILFFIVSLFEHDYSSIKSIDTNTLNTILRMKSWNLEKNNEPNLANQQIFMKVELIQFSNNFSNYPPSISNENAAEVTSAMYLALGCKYGETVIDMLNSLKDELLKKNTKFSMETVLVNINETILKTI